MRDNFYQLFDMVGEESVSNNTYTVREIPSVDANAIVKKYHYSGKVVSNSALHLGIFNNSNILVGALQYGYPMNGAKTSLKISDNENMFELNRMVLADSEPRNSESQAISICNKWLKKYRSDIDWLLSFSDGKENNCGYIYQATNWKYLGYILSDSFYDLDGEIVHNVTVWHNYKEKHELRDTHTTNQILSLNFKNVSKIKSKQHVYVYPLKKKIQFLHSEKPYPKMDTEIAILEKIFYQVDGVPVSYTEVYHMENLSPIF